MISIYQLNCNNSTLSECKYFEHNSNISVNTDTFKYVFRVKQQLLYNLNSLLNDLNVKYVISHGNLIEYKRKNNIS